MQLLIEPSQFDSRRRVIRLALSPPNKMPHGLGAVALCQGMAIPGERLGMPRIKGDYRTEQLPRFGAAALPGADAGHLQRRLDRLRPQLREARPTRKGSLGVRLAVQAAQRGQSITVARIGRQHRLVLLGSLGDIARLLQRTGVSEAQLYL